MTRVVWEPVGADRAVLRADADDLAAERTFLSSPTCLLPTIPPQLEVGTNERKCHQGQYHEQHRQHPTQYLATGLLLSMQSGSPVIAGQSQAGVSAKR